MKRKRCEDCGQLKEDVKITNCPFAEEINNELIKVKICDACYKERLWGI